MAASPDTVDPDTVDEERIAKRLSRIGVCSRREAERMIEARRIAIDGVVVTSPAIRVAPDARLTVDGKPVKQAERARLWRYHKPNGLICTNRDPQGRETIFDRLPKTLPRVVTIGRLDLTSEGLLLLTNDGALARRLEHPAGPTAHGSSGWPRASRSTACATVRSRRGSSDSSRPMRGSRWRCARARTARSARS